MWTVPAQRFQIRVFESNIIKVERSISMLKWDVQFQGIVMVFAVDDQQSFLNIRTWLQNIEDVSSYKDYHILFILSSFGPNRVQFSVYQIHSIYNIETFHISYCRLYKKLHVIPPPALLNQHIKSRARFYY